MSWEDPANEKKDTDAHQADEPTIVAFQACNPKISAVVCSLLIKYFLHCTKVGSYIKISKKEIWKWKKRDYFSLWLGDCCGYQQIASDHVIAVTYLSLCTAMKTINVFLEKCGLSPIFHILVSVIDLCIPRIGPNIFLQQNWQTDGGKTHEYGIWDWGRAIPFLEMSVLNFRYCVFDVCVDDTGDHCRFAGGPTAYHVDNDGNYGSCVE